MKHLNIFGSMKKWLWVHKKKLIVHALILCSFVLYALFLADYLFDRLAAVPGESKLQKKSLPSKTDDIIYGIDFVIPDWRVIEVQGWAFIEGQDTVGSKIYIILKSDKNAYVFDTTSMNRKDITAYFSRLGLNLNLNNSGFEAIIPSRKIEKGQYIVGLYIIKDGIHALRYLDKAIVKSKDDVKSMLRTSKLQEFFLPGESNDMRGGIDFLREVIEDGTELIEVAGWAFINGQGSKGGKIYLVLKSADGTYVFDTFLQKRLDVTHAFEQLGVNVNDSGFLARIPKKDVKKSRYRLGIYIYKEPFKALHYTKKVIKLQ